MSHSTGQIEPRRLDNAKLLSWSSCSSLSKTYGCALLIIGVIGFAAAGVGLASFGNIQGWWVAGSLSSLGQATAIALMATGGSLAFLTVALATTSNYVRNRGKGKQGRAGASPASSPKSPVIPTTVPPSAPVPESSKISDSEESGEGSSSDLEESEAVPPQGGMDSSAAAPSSPQPIIVTVIPSPQPETLIYSRPLVLSTWQKIRLAKRKEALENGEFNSITPRQLALIHGDTFICGEKAFEGAPSDYVIEYERRRLESYRAVLSSPDREYPFVDPNLSLDEIDNILLDFEDFRQAAAIQDSAEMIAFIDGGLERRRRCVIPIRVRGREVGDPGHIFTCAITEDEKGGVYFHLMNKGEGSEMNPSLIGGSQQKVSYRYPSIRLKDRAILNPESDVGNSFFTRLRKFSTEKPPDNTDSYRSSEVYNLFLLIGEVDHTYRPLTSEESSISQWSGTCHGQLAKLLIRDNSRSQGNNRKKQDFAQRFDSLRDGVKSIDLKPSENRALLEKVLHGFCNLVEKSYPSLISEDELVSALALIEWADEKLQRAKSEAIQKREFSLVKGELPTSFEGGEKFPASIGQASAPDKSGASGAARPAHVPQPSLNPPENVMDLKRLLEEQWIPYLDHLKGLEKARFVFLALQELPVPRRADDAFWDEIPQEEIGPLVEKIRAFAMKGLQTLWDAHKWEKENDYAYNKNGRFAGYDAIINHYQMGITLAALTHVFKLCTLIPELNLGEYSLPISELPIVQGRANWDEVISDLGECYPGDREVIQHDGNSAGAYLSWPSADRRDKFERYVQFFKCEDESKYLWPKRLIDLPGSEVEKSFVEDVCGRQHGQSNLVWDSVLDYLQSLFPQFETELEGANSTAHKYNNLWTEVLPAKFPPFATLREFMEQFVFSGNSVSNISLLELYRWDPEFEQTHSLLRPYHVEVGTENAMSRQLEKPFAGSNAVAQELRKAQIASRPSIRVAFLLNWMRENSTGLEHRGVQQEIMARFLKRGIIPEAFAEEPSLRGDLTAFIDAKLANYLQTPRLIETAFFLIRLRYRIESCTSMDSAEVEKVAAPLREAISRHDPSSIHTRFHILYLQTHRTSLTAEEWGEIVDGFLEVKNSYGMTKINNSLLNEISLFLCKNQEALHRELGPRRDIWEPILRRVAKEHSCESEEIEGSFPLFHLGQLSIDFSTGEIDFPRTRHLLSFDEIVDSEERSSGSSSLTDGYLQRLENQCRGRKWFYENRNSYESVLEKTFSADDLFRFHRGSYVSPAEGNDPGEKTMRLLLDAREIAPVCLVIYDKEKTEVFKLNKKRELTGDKLVSEPTKIDQLKSLVNMFSTSHLRPRLWQNQTTGLVTVEWPQLGLKFVTQDDGKLYCQQFPGFYVAADQHITELYPFQNGVILTNAQEEEKVLLPRLDLFEKSRIFQGEAEGGKLEETKEIGEGQTYFVYNRRAVRGHLHSSSVPGMVYLMVVNVIQGNYEEATWILSQLGDDESATKFEVDIFRGLLRFDKTKLDPCRSSFYLKWYLRIKEITALYPGREKLVEMEEVFLLPKHNSFYHRLQSLHGVCRLPYYLVLSKEERARIESFLGTVPTRGGAAAESAFFTWVNKSFYLNSSDPQFQKVLFPNLSATKDSIRLEQKKGSWVFSQAYEYFRTLKEDVPIIEMDFSALLFSGYNNDLLKLLYIVAISDSEDFPLFPKHLVGWERGRYDIRRDVELFLNDVIGKAREKGYKIPRREIKPGPAVKVGEGPSLAKPPYEELHHAEAADYSPSSEVGDRAFPLRTLCTGSLVPSAEATIENGEFVLSGMEGALSTDLARALHERLSAAHVNSQKISRYSIPDRGALEGEIEGLIERQSSAAQLLREKIEKRANRTPLDEEGEVESATWKKAIHEQVRLLGKKRAHLTMNNHLYTAFLSQNPQLLKVHNPFLSEAEVKGIFQMIADYMVICSRVDQAKEAQRSLKSGQDSDQEIGEILHKRRSYDHNEFPALLVYEYATGMILRPEQAELLKKIFNAQNISHCQELLVEFQAGGGKTKVIAAILSFLAKEKGKLPVFFSLPALHDITKVDLSESLSQVFIQRLKVLHLQLHGQYSDEYLRNISKIIKEWKEDGCSVQMVPESWHTLNLLYQFALREKAEARIAICQDILKFFYENGYFIIDEAHRNVQSLWQANISTGRPISFEKDEKRLFVLCYRALTGHTGTPLKLKDGRLLHEVLKLEENGQALATDAEKEEILSLLADYLLKKLKVEETRRDEIRQYLLHESIPMPSCVGQLYENGDRRKAELLFLSRGLLSQVLTPVLGMVHMFDYGGSVREGEEIEDPRFQRNPSLSQYENPDIAATLCNQGLYQRGLSEPQMKKLLKLLYVEHKQSPEIVRDPTKTPQALLFMEWQRKVGIAEPVSIEEDPAENAQLLKELCKKMGHMPEVIEKYLGDILLAQIKIYPEKVTSTAVDLVEGGAEVILLSATLGLVEEYPERESVHAEEDTVFQAAVIQRGCAPQNREMHWLTPSTPRQLFVDLYQENPALMDDLEGIIDIGGWNRDYSTVEVAHDFLDFITEKKLPIDGVVYITEDSSSLTEKSELVVLLKDGNGGKTKRLKGSNLNKALKENGLTGLRLFKIYGPSQCTGTDLQLAKDGRMLVALGETITLWPLIQAIMRARAFIKAESEQKLVWVGPNALKPLIPNVEESGPEALFIWALQKEADRMHRGIMARAFQSISGAVRGYVKREKLLKADASQEQIEIFDQHAKAFAEELDRNLFALYAGAEEQVDVELILTSFAQSYRAGVQLSEEEWKASHCKKKVKRIIAQTKKLIRTAPSKSVTPSLSVGYQHAVNEDEGEAKTEKEVENRMQKTSVGAFGRVGNWREEKYVVNEYAIDSADLTKEGSEVRVSANGYCGVADCFAKDLYLLTNARKTVGVEDPHFKKLNFWLLVLENEEGVERKYAYAVSIWDATNYFDQLQAGRGIAGRRAALMTSDGIVVCNGQGEKGISAEKLSELRGSLWMQKVLSDLAFLNGRVHDIVFLEKQIAYWQEGLGGENFRVLWKRIQDMQLTPDGMHESAIDELAARMQYRFSPEECEEIGRLTT